MHLEPIGLFRCAAKYPYDAPRQGSVATENRGTVELYPGRNFEQALRGVEGFSHLWLLFQFHHNEHWKPVVQPPRGQIKVGVFASRAPYRPNPLGLSCVRLLSVKGRLLDVGNHDLLDETPIFDIKPYLPYADAFPEAIAGWTQTLDRAGWHIVLSEPAREHFAWLHEQGLDCMEAFAMQQLSAEPFDAARKRVVPLEGERWALAYRTWRIRFSAAHQDGSILVEDIVSGYTAEERQAPEDPHGDKAIHRAFVARYGADEASA